jgi:hypothetical protein
LQGQSHHSGAGQKSGIRLQNAVRMPSGPAGVSSASVRAMADDSSDEGLRRRIARSGEDALGRIAQDLLENSLVNGAITRAFEAREKAAQAQEVAMGALNLPSAADLERLTRRVRSVSQRLEGIEDGVDRLDRSLASASGAVGLEERLEAIERSLETIAADVEKLTKAAKPAPRRRTASKPKPKAAASMPSAPATGDGPPAGTARPAESEPPAAGGDATPE